MIDSALESNDEEGDDESEDEDFLQAIFEVQRKEREEARQDFENALKTNHSNV